MSGDRGVLKLVRLRKLKKVRVLLLEWWVGDEGER